MLTFEDCPKNIKLSICKFLSYGDILAFGQTCKSHQKYISDNDFWVFLIINKFGISLDGTQKPNGKYKFLEMTIKSIIEPYLDGDFGDFVVHIEKCDNVLAVTVNGYVDGNYYFVIQFNGENQLLVKHITDSEAYFFYDRNHCDIALICLQENSMTVIHTERCEIIQEATLITNVDLFDIRYDLDNPTMWIRYGNIWLFTSDEHKIELDMVGFSLVVK